jgi:hypothetical protein
MYCYLPGSGRHVTRQYQGIFSAGGRAPRIRENSLGTRLHPTAYTYRPIEPILDIYEQQFVYSERHLLDSVFQVPGLSISNIEYRVQFIFVVLI